MCFVICITSSAKFLFVTFACFPIELFVSHRRVLRVWFSSVAPVVKALGCLPSIHPLAFLLFWKRKPTPVALRINLIWLLLSSALLVMFSGKLMGPSSSHWYMMGVWQKDFWEKFLLFLKDSRDNIIYLFLLTLSSLDEVPGIATNILFPTCWLN